MINFMHKSILLGNESMFYNYYFYNVIPVIFWGKKCDVWKILIF